MRSPVAPSAAALVVGALGLLRPEAVSANPVDFPGPSEFYIRLIVQSDSLVDNGNILGRLEGASDGHDSSDMVEMPPFGPPYLTIVFPHPEWGPDAGDYTVDYREARPGASGLWSFEVRSDQARPITLSWEVVSLDPDDLLARSTLQDLASGISVQPEPGGSYGVTMTGIAHTMAWLVNGRPMVWAGPDIAVDSLTVVQLPPSTFTDEDLGDTHTATVDWGDGTVEPALVDDVSQTVTGSHLYQGLGQRTANVCVADGHGSPGCDSFVVTVECALGDVDGLGTIDGQDLVALAAHLFGTAEPCPDVNTDGLIDAADLAAEVILVDQWYVPPPPTASWH